MLDAGIGLLTAKRRQRDNRLWRRGSSHGTLLLRAKAHHLAAIPERAAVFLSSLTGQYRYSISLLDAVLKNR